MLERKINPLKIAFISIETPIYNNIGLEQLFSYCRRATGQDDFNGWYVMFDEIQYLKDWEIHLKSLVDSYPNTKFVVSGSAAAALKVGSIESGAGRFTDFILPPLNFNEFLHLKNLEHLIIDKHTSKAVDSISSNNIGELNRHFLDYINFGGYPEVIFSEKIQNDPGRYIRSDIIDKVLLRDLPSLYGIRDVQELNSLFTTITYNSGNEVSLEELSKNSGVEKNTIRRYLKYLEAAFLIKIINKISNKPKKFKRVTNFKIYLTNPSLRSALFSPLEVNSQFMGNMVETAIYSQWLHDDNRDNDSLYYARWQNGEVDMVWIDKTNMRPVIVSEIKWSDRYYDNPKQLRSLLKFLKDNNLKTALVTTITKEGVKIVDDIELIFVPSSIYAYFIGKKNNDRENRETLYIFIVVLCLDPYFWALLIKHI